MYVHCTYDIILTLTKTLIIITGHNTSLLYICSNH